jgi:pantothenate kinase
MDREKYPQELFNTEFGEYLNSVEQRSKKDYVEAVETIIGVGLGAYALYRLLQKKIKVSKLVEAPCAFTSAP